MSYLEFKSVNVCETGQFVPNRALFAILAIIFINCCAFASPVLAVEPRPPGLVPLAGPPPAPGGPNPPVLIRGDEVPMAPATGTSERGPGNWFPHRPEEARMPSNLGRYATSNGRGVRGVLPDSEPRLAPNADLDDSSLERIQERQYPYPEYDMSGPVVTRRVETTTGPRSEDVATKFISLDLAGRINYQPNQSWTTHEQQRSPLPTVALFSRILVILGVVFATVYMAFAAMGVVLGHKDAGQRVVGTAGGLMLLLMAYSIYKLVMIHAFLFPNSSTMSIHANPEPSRQALHPANTPITPANRPTRRSNLPVVPFGNAQNP